MREKTNKSEGEKMKQELSISNLNNNPNTLWSPDILTGPESHHPGFLESVKIVGDQT